MILAVDTETTGTDFFHGCRPFMITACDGETVYTYEGEVNPYTRDVYWADDVLDEVRELLSKAHKIVFHNACFDIRALSCIGVEVDWNKVEDTLVASHCICSGDSHGLKDLAIKYLHYWDDDERELAEAAQAAHTAAKREGFPVVAQQGHRHFPGLNGAGISWYKMDYWLVPEACRTYAGRDAERTWLLWKTFLAALRYDGLVPVYNKRRKLLKILYDMTSTGIYFYKNKAVEYIEEHQAEMEKLRWKIKESAGIVYKFDPNKRDHLIDLIHKKLNIPVLFYTKGSNSEHETPSMDKNALKYYLENYDAEPIKYLSRWKVIQTKVNYMTSYINWLCDDSRVHCGWNLTGTRNTRQSASAPNMQNVDKALAHYFGPPPGKVWLDLDMVNIELRIWTYEVGNKELIGLFEKGESVHLLIAELIHSDLFKKLGPSRFKERTISPQNEYTKVKNGNFARIYGATDKKANSTYGVDDACSIIDRRFPEIKPYMEKTAEDVWRVFREDGVCAIYTLGGYRLDVPADEPFKACNFKIQGTAGEIMGLAMIDLVENDEYIESGSQIVMQVHDSLKIEIPIHKALDYTINSMLETIKNAAKRLIPTCDLTYDVIVHEYDQNNPIVSKYVKEVPF